MKLVANRINGTHQRDILPVLSAYLQVDSVLAAIGCGNSAADSTKDLLGHCLANHLRLDLWMRYDHTVPVSVELLRRLFRHHKDNIFTQFIPRLLLSQGYLVARLWCLNRRTIPTMVG